VNRLDRNVEDLGGFLHAEAAEEAHLHHLTLSLVEFSERLERFIELQQSFIAMLADH